MTSDQTYFIGTSADAHSNILLLALPQNRTARVTFLEEGIFRLQVSPDVTFLPYAVPRDPEHKARIPQYPDSSTHYCHPIPHIGKTPGYLFAKSGPFELRFARSSGLMQIFLQDCPILQEARPMELSESKTSLFLRKRENEQFFGGGTQNGRFVHTGRQISIVNESAWMDGGVASPSPFYFSTGGYGILRNTFRDGCYDFGSEETDVVRSTHDEASFDAYFFLSDREGMREIPRDLLRKYYAVTGNPLLLPAYGFYEGHLNCFNRDSWSKESGSKEWNIKGTENEHAPGVSFFESGMATGYRLEPGLHAESLNGERPTVAAEQFPDSVDTPMEFSARSVLEQYLRFDMPLGYFLPNDGYGGGYGQNGYYRQGGVNEDGSSSAERLEAVQANVDNFARFTEFANKRGVASGLWTESRLSPDSDPNTFWHLLRDFRREVTDGGATTLKTDVAWVGPGYSFQLNGVKTAYDIVTRSTHFRPNIISLDGWAGSQRFNSVWTGDQTGGNWEYIRFHIPTYIGSSLSGNPNIGSDMDGIFGGKPLIATRDYQWKSFTPQMLNMDGWGSCMKSPYTFGDPFTGINRMYLKLKSKLMPYIGTIAASASNLDTGNRDTGLPMVRAMFLEFPDDPLCVTRSVQYQFLFGPALLVAPIYQNTAADARGNDVRNGIYLPDPGSVWIDYLTGEKYRGGRTLDNFNAPVWKLPVFVRNGSILPMVPANNNPDSIDHSRRIAEFWPEGESSFTVYEDDGKFVENQTVDDSEYGLIDQISYGSHVSVRYTSRVHNGTATLCIGAASGTYPGFCRQQQTDLVVHVSRRPDRIQARTGDQELQVRELSDRSSFEAAVPAENEAVFFYDRAPVLPDYASEAETVFRSMISSVRTEPKLCIRLGRTDIAAADQTVLITGFENALSTLPERPDPALQAPVLTEVPDAKTPTSVLLSWEAVPEALRYEMLVDGQLHSMGDACSFLHSELSYESEHSYRIRAHGEAGYSDWSKELRTVTLIDPWRNEIGAQGRITFEGDDEAGALKYAFDHSTKGLFFAADDIVGKQIPFLYDFRAVYDLDKFEYYPRDSYGSGCVQQMDLSVSLDGVHWQLVWDGTAHDDWTYDRELEVEDNVKTIPLSGISARYLKLEIRKSTRNFFAAHELPVYKKDGSLPFAVGSTNKNETVSAGDYTNMKNYLGTCRKDGANFVDQIEKRCGDINRNGIYDVYDYAYTMFALDGGTRQTGSVSGALHLTADRDSVCAGELLTLAVCAEAVENLNAFGKVLHYDPALVEFLSLEQEDCIRQMENLTVSKRYPDGTAYLNLAFANRGDQPLYSGSEKLVTITMKARQAFRTEEVFELRNMTLIGPEFDTIEA